MTIAATATKVIYSGDGSTVNFSFDFRLIAATDLVVVKRTVADGTEEVLELTTDYTMYALNNDYSAGGVVTLLAAPSADYEVCLYRATAATQETDYTDGSAFPAASHEAALDKLTMIIQELQEQLSRALLVPVSETDDDTDMTLPDKIDRASNALAFDTDGNPTV